MGQSVGSGIEFEDNYRCSDVDRGGSRVKCTRTAHFTQLTKAAVDPMDEMSITCKVYKLEGSPIGLGLVPVGSKEKCVTNLIGTSDIPGSIACHIAHGHVALVANGDTFFTGSCNTSNPTNIQMRFRGGKVSYAIDGRTLDSSQLNGMTFTGDHLLGVGMTEEDQLVEVYPTCPFTFVDRWSAGRLWSDTMQVKHSCNFTYYSQELVQPQGKYSVVANFRRNCENSCGIGIVADSKKDTCQSELVGMFTGSIGFIFKDKQLFISMNGDVCFACSGNTSDPCVAEMSIDDGKVSFKFDGKKLDCDKLAAARFNTPFRVGVGLSAEGQTVEMRGAVDKSKLRAAPSTIRWKDNMRSINCDGQDFVAISRKDFAATVHSQQVIDPEGNEEVEIRVLTNPGHAQMIIGLVDSDPDGHANSLIGQPDLENSIGLTNGGNAVLRGQIEPSSGVGFMAGDLVKIAVKDKSLRIFVNGKDAAPRLHHLSLKSKFRYAVSFTKEGQAVKIGASTLTSAQLDFCKDQSVAQPRDKPVSDPIREAQLKDISARAGSGHWGHDLPLCWKDTMRSVQCDSKQVVAVGVKSFTATLYMQKVIDVTGAPIQVQIRILNNPNDASLLVGAMDEAVSGHHNSHLGESGFGNSIGLTNRGKLMLEGSHHGGLGPGFKAGDLVKLVLGGGKLKISVNGVEAAPGLSDLSFKSKFRFAVSFTKEGQAVKIGADRLTEDEQIFLLENNVQSALEEPSPAKSNISHHGSGGGGDPGDASPAKPQPSTVAASPAKSSISHSGGGDAGSASPAKPQPTTFTRQGFGGHAAPRYVPPLELVKNFTPDPSKTCAAYILEDGARELGATVPHLRQIVMEAGRITKSLIEAGTAPPQLTPPQLFAIVCYTFDMKLIDPVAESTQNFYAQLNMLLQTRNAARIANLRGYLYFLMSGLQALPEHHGTVYRGLDAHGLEVVKKHYRKAAKVHWSGMSSTTLDYGFAKQMAGADGIVLKIEVTHDARVLGDASALPDEQEVLALPSFGGVVMSDVYVSADGMRMLDLHEAPKERVVDLNSVPEF